jgi:DNA-binding CsgD family transcriptional regulator/cell division protein FtsL
MLSACHSPQREARQMVRRAECLFDTMPDSTARLIDSVLRMPVYFGERQRMDMALLQAEALFGDHGQEIPPLMDDDFFDDHANLSTSPELERAAAYYAKKKKYNKAAHAALYSGFVQQHYNDKTTAMQSFKEAEHYGELAGDSLAVARAEYRTGKLLYNEGRKQESLTLLKDSEKRIGNRPIERALIENSKAILYILLNQNDSAEFCLRQSLYYADNEGANKLKYRVLNNYAVLYRRQKEYDSAINCLKQLAEIPHLNDNELFIYYLNMGKTFMVIGENDSAALYFRYMEKDLSSVQVKDETKVSAYDALFRFVANQNHDSLALQYHEIHENLLYEVMWQQQEQNMYRIQKQYDYESLQNTLNKKIILRHRIILIISILLFIAAIIILLLQYRHKQLLEEESMMKRQIDTMKQELRQTVKSSVMDEEVALRLRMILTANRTTKKAKDPQNVWLPLVLEVMNGKDSLFEAARATIEMAYPNVYSILMQKHPSLSETEAKVCLLSFSDLSNSEIAELLNLKQNTVNQNRSTLRKKLNLKPERMKEQLRNALAETAS